MFIDFRSKNGGGSGDAYSKAETDELLAKKANSTELTEEKGRAEQAEEVLDGKIVANTEAIQNKADKSTTYTKDEVDSALSNKADASAITDIDSKLQSKADSSDVNAIAESLSTTQEIVAQKANIGDSYTKAESDAKYLTSYTETDPIWESEKRNYYDKTQVDAILYNKADVTSVYTKSQVDSALANKTNTSFDNLTTEGKENLKSIIVGGNATVDNNHVVSSSESALKWTIDFKDTDYVEIKVTKGEASNWYGAQFSPSGEYLNVYGLGGNTSLLTLYRKDNDEQLDIYDGEGYNPTTLDNYYIKIAEGCKVTYNNAARLVSESKGMIEETDPVWNAEKGNYYTKSEADNNYQPKGSYLSFETDPVWNAQKVNYYTKSQVDKKISDVELYKFPNVTLFGEPSINGGQLSNFSATNYAQFPFLVDLTGKEFIIQIVFTTSNDITSQQNIIDSKYGLAIAVKEGKVVCAMGTNGTSWNLGENVIGENIVPNHTYYLQLNYFDNYYIGYFSENGFDDIWSHATMYVSSQESLYPTIITIGKSLDNTHIFNGSINLNGCSLTIKNNTSFIKVWSGMDDAGLATRLATDMSNIDAEGVNKVKEIAKTEIPSLDGYATEQWVNDKNYITGYTETDPVWNAEKGNYYTKSEVDSNIGNIQLKTINGESIKGTGNIVIQGGSGDAYTKAESDALLANKTNTNLDNISDEGKENLKNMFKGNMHTIDFNGSSTHSINSEEAAQKWYLNYDNEIFNIWGDFMFYITQTGTFWDIYHNEYDKPEGTVTFRCTGSTEGIEIYDKATDTKISTDADLDLTVDENSFYIKFLDRLYTIRTDYYEYADGLFYNGTAPLLDVYTKSEIKENYYSKNEINQTYASQYYVNNTFEKKSDIEGDVNHYIDTYNFKTINGEYITNSGNLDLVPTSYLEDANNYAELHFFDENDNETTLLLLKKN